MKARLENIKEEANEDDFVGQDDFDDVQVFNQGLLKQLK